MVKIPLPLEGIQLVDIGRMSSSELQRKLDSYVEAISEVRDTIPENSGVENAMDRCLLVHVEHVAKRMQDIILMRG